MDIDFELRALGRITIAMILCGLLGWERSSVGKSAGLRTHILVGIGAAMFVVLPQFIVQAFSSWGEMLRFDPTRVLEAVAAGVSFLGAGSIIFARGMDRVHGLTTAASLWTTASVGLAAGLGKYVLATGATLIVLLVLGAVRLLERDRGEKVRDVPKEEVGGVKRHQG